MNRGSWWWVVAVAGVACGGEAAAPRPAFEQCESDDDCAAGLFCAQGGPLVNHCALGCDEDAECQARFGESHACVETVCVQVCGWLEYSCREPESTDFESCGAGLGCRGEDSGACASFCTAASWGEERRDEGFTDGSIGFDESYAEDEPFTE